MRPGTSLIIWYAVLLHALWGGLLLLSDSTLGATSIHMFERAPQFAVAAMFLTVAALAAFGVTRHRPTGLSLTALLPQQALLSISAVAAIQSVADSRYGDGVTRPWPFILADQAPAIIILVLHTVAIIWMHRAQQADYPLRAALDAARDELERLHVVLAQQADALGEHVEDRAEPTREQARGD